MDWRVYEKKVKVLLGVKVYQTFLNAADSGEISEQHMADIAYKLSDTVGGEFKRSRDSRVFACDNRAARAVLANWFHYDLSKRKVDSETAVATLVTILRDDNISLYPLAAEINKAPTAVKENNGSIFCGS